MSSSSIPAVDYLIVGAGVNGTSIATTLISLGFSVAVLDRSPDGFVAPDGASHDLNKIVRADYTDANYCTLAKEAISRWRSNPVLSPFYHEVGVLFRSSDRGRVFGAVGSGSAEEYVEAGVKHARLSRDEHLELAAPGKVLVQPAYKLASDEQVKDIFNARRGGVGVELGEGLKGMGSKQTGYFNPRGGWAEANNACRALLEHAVRLGVQVYSNATVTAFTYDVGRVSGVQTSDGRRFSARQVVLAAGAWTSDLLSTLSPHPNAAALPSKWMTRPSAQCVAVLRLTPTEAHALKDTPVIINFSSGFYQFEPVHIPGVNEWHMKIAYHSNGYLYPKPPVECNGGYPAFEDSAAACPTGPREIGGEGDRAEDVGYEMAESTIPASRLDHMLAELAQIYPALAQKERVIATRVCWYSDTLDENWIIDTLNSHPAVSQDGKGRVGENVWVVSGDSGHAYKFLPMIGDLFATIAGLCPNTRRLDLSRFTFAHQARLHADKNAGRPVESADSNRFDASKPTSAQSNPRARL